MGGGADGSFRATFEDKPLLSDTVFLRAWVAVELPRLHNPVTNLLGPPPAPPAFARARRAQEVGRPLPPRPTLPRHPAPPAPSFWPQCYSLLGFLSLWRGSAVCRAPSWR